MSGRFTHSTGILSNRPQSREQGKQQGEISVVRYHYLCAAVQRAYDFIDNIPPDLSRSQIFARQGLSFSKYHRYKLDPVLGIKLNPQSDGTIHQAELKAYVDGFRQNWKVREAEILYAVAESRAFWNLILHFHSPAATTGMKEYDQVLSDLKASNYDRGVVPCMWFARESGCLDTECPFLHDKEAAMKDRALVLEERKEMLLKPTLREISLREKSILEDLDERIPGIRNMPYHPEMKKMFEDSGKIVKICFNHACLKAQMQDGPSMSMRKCSRCQYATYCSVDCQKEDWPRHKTEPCQPMEQILDNDDLWTRYGTRKGTGRWNLSLDDDM